MAANWRSRSLILGTIATIPFAFAGCPQLGNNGDGDGNGQLTSGGKLVAFKSSDEWITFFRREASRDLSGGGGRNLYEFFSNAAPQAGGATDTATAAEDGGDSGGDQSFSTTNLQESGVDEADIVKSDGANFYIAKSNSLRIVRANPRAEMAEIAKLNFTEYISEMYLFDNTVIVLAQSYNYAGDGRAEILLWPPYYNGALSVLYQIDVTDPANPVQLSRIELDGSLVNSRLTNGRVIVVLSISPELPVNPTPLTVGNLAIEDVMPKMRTADGASDLVPWDHWLYPESPDSYLMTAVLTLNAAKIDETVGSVAILARAGTIYASTESLYVSDTDYDYRGGVRETVTLHKFTFDSNGAAQYVASGNVPGRLLNQFSLGEHEEALRVATHLDALGGRAFGGADDIAVDSSTAQAVAPVASNAVYVLKQFAGSLDITGRVEGIAPNERIYSARFIGDRGYLVTFRQIDPLFVLNLSDPAAPAIVGELKIPGYSDYLHPIDETHLIGLGRSTETTPWGGVVPKSLQLSLFDVSDPANPIAIQQLSLGGFGSYSDVSYTHKAFTYLPEQGLLAIPATLWPEDYDPYSNNYFAYVGPSFQGVVCFQLDTSVGFTELGRVAAVLPGGQNNDYFYGGAWNRAAFIGDTVYALNDLGVRAAPRSDFSATTTVTLAPSDPFDPYPFDGDGTEGSDGGTSDGSAGSPGGL